MGKIGNIICNPSVIGQYVNGVINARHSDSVSYDLAFVKEDNGNWYIDLPQWKGSHGNLQMVAGADRLLDYLLSDGNRVEVQVVKSRDRIREYENNDMSIKCRRVDDNSVYGATYTVLDLENHEDKMWICPVTLFVLGEYPQYLYIMKK